MKTNFLQIEQTILLKQSLQSEDKIPKILTLALRNILIELTTFNNY